jgi:hypothetical protein
VAKVPLNVVREVLPLFLCPDQDPSLCCNIKVRAEQVVQVTIKPTCPKEVSRAEDYTSTPWKLGDLQGYLFVVTVWVLRF